MKEIEKKYLLKGSIISLIKEYDLYGHKITQFYTTITPVKGVRYRKIDDRYFKTIKYGTGASRDENETEISKTKFQKRLKDRINEPIRKNRYILDIEGQEYSIDVFKKDLKDFFILEVEFQNIESFEQFKLPKLLEPYIIKDVSFDESYKNKNIVLNGIPLTNSNLVFSELDKKNIKALDAYFISDLTSIDALRIILYKFTLSILHYKDLILLTDDTENLHQFRINIRKSRAFLKEFGSLMPKNHHNYFSENLADISTQTNHKRDLDVIEKRLGQLDKKHKIIQKDIQVKQKSENHHIHKMLKSKKFKDFFYTYQKILTTKTPITSDIESENIGKTARDVIKNLHYKIIKKINALEENFDVDKLHKIRISLKKLRYLLEEFQLVFGEEKIEKIIEQGKKLQDLLGDFNDAVNQKKLLHSYFKENKKKFPDGKKIEIKLLNKTINTEEKLRLKAIKKLHEFKMHPLEL